MPPLGTNRRNHLPHPRVNPQHPFRRTNPTVYSRRKFSLLDENETYSTTSIRLAPNRPYTGVRGTAGLELYAQNTGNDFATGYNDDPYACRTEAVVERRSNL